jgi:RNA-directed DNA polymerase
MGDLSKILSGITGLSMGDVNSIVVTAPRRYKTYFIPKRSGGLREIAQPARELKALQYALIEHTLSKLPVHLAATAYRTGASIADNAKVHAGDTPILKMDFKEFFPSIHAVDWRKYCIMNEIMDIEDIALSSQLLFRRAKKEKTLKLSIGAPSSPILSNILLYYFDEYVVNAASTRHIRYTRYADDMTFSGQRIGILRDMLKVVQSAVRETVCPRLQINNDKTNFVSTKFSRNVTGLVLGNSGEIGIGREKLRLLRARMFRALAGETTPEELRSLAGYLSFVRGADRSSFDKIVSKYGESGVSTIMRHATYRHD